MEGTRTPLAPLFVGIIGIAGAVLLSSAMGLSQQTGPCDCPLVRLDDAYCYSDIVFEGVAVKGDTTYVQGGMEHSDADPTDRVLVRFKVERVLKGEFPTLVTVIASAKGEHCGYNFIGGQRYVVFASVEDGVMTTDRCTPTRPMDTVTRGFADSLAYVMSGKQWEGRVPMDKPCR
jgi:hypothetical protein